MQKIPWTRVYEQEAGRLLGVAYRYVKDRKQAEDIVQNAFVIAIQKAETFKGKGAFEAWLRRIVVNESLMHLRAKHPVFLGLDERVEMMTEVDTEDNVRAGHAPPPNETMYQIIQQAEFTQDDLLETANLLPEHHRVVFFLYVVDNYSHKDIAQQLNISEGTSKSHLNRGRKKLQELLYERALDMKKHRKKSFFVIPWFLALFGKTKANPIDTLYREAFANFALPVPPVPVGLELAAGSTVSVGLSTGVVAGITTAVCGGAIVVGTLTYQAISDNDPSLSEVEVQPVPAIYYEIGTDVDVRASDTAPSPEIETPVRAGHVPPVPKIETVQAEHAPPAPETTTDSVILIRRTVIIDTIDIPYEN